MSFDFKKEWKPLALDGGPVSGLLLPAGGRGPL